MKTIGVMVPTKSRPERLRTLYDSFVKYTEGNSAFVVGIDTDELDLYNWVLEFPDIRVIETLPEDYVAKANYMAKSMREYDYLYLLADDFVINSRFESVFLDAAVKNCVFYGRDSLANEKLPTAPFMDNNIFKKLGYVAPPALIHYFADNVWRDWGEGCGTYRYIPEVSVQHLHMVADPKYTDNTYTNSSPHFETDWAAYDLYVENDLKSDLEKLKK